MNQYFKYLKNDVPAAIVVFLVALPLCLGIALASGAPLFSGIIAGIIGGMVVGALSNSQLGVSGPAAGLAVIVLNGIQALSVFENFLLAVVLCGVFQVIFGLLRFGAIVYYFPSSVIKGMLAAIGIMIILKQIPHALGVDKDFEGDEEFFQPDGQTTLSEIWTSLDIFNESALIIGIFSLLLLIFWDSKIIQQNKFFKQIPGSLVCVIIGILFYNFLPLQMALAQEHLVRLPVTNSLQTFLTYFTMPNWAAINNPLVWQTALVMAVVASIETLLCVEATDKLDPEKRITSPSRELWAQGVGNILSGLVGGIPITQVIVRSSANIQSGGKTKMSAITHGVLLLVSVLTLPTLLNQIPLASLAAVLIMVGYKLAKPTLFKAMFKEGQDQFIPFIITILAIVFTDLLKGISIGLLVGLGYVLYTNFSSSIISHKDGKNMMIKFNKDAFFYNKSRLVAILSTLKEGDFLYVDGTAAQFIDYDIFLVLEDLQDTAKKRNITIEFKGISKRKINYRKSDAIISKTLISE